MKRIKKIKTKNIKAKIFQEKIINIEDKQRRSNIIIIEVTTEGSQSKGVEEITQNYNSKNIS